MEIIYKNKEGALFSEPNNFCKMRGLEFVWSDRKKFLYVFPMNTRGTHDLRWFSIPKRDIPQVIEGLQKMLKK